MGAENVALRWYRRLVLTYPAVTLALVFLPAILLAYYLHQFEIEASTDSLVLEEDPDLKFYERSRLIFGSDEYVIVSLRMENPFTREGLGQIKSLADGLKQVPGIEGVQSIVDMPLFRNRPGPVNPLVSVTLLTPGCDLEGARAELVENVICRGNLISEDGRTVSVIATLRRAGELSEAQQEVFEAEAEVDRRQKAGEEVGQDLKRKLREAKKRFRALDGQRRGEREKVVASIREVVQRQAGSEGSRYLSGLPMIVVDMVEYIRKDLWRFGLAAVVLFVAVLGAVFGRVRWVVLPLVTCGVCVVMVLGVMGLLGKRTSVVTSNLPSLVLILSLAHSIYLISKFREVVQMVRDSTQRVMEVVGSLAEPCAYTSVTTVAGFSSLAVSGNRPVMDFGIFMGMGVALSFVISFTLLPAALRFVSGRRERARPPERFAVFRTLGNAVLEYRWGILVVSVALVGASIVGVARIKVETKFIDYFDDESDIYQGLAFIDQEMGGTTSLEVILTGKRPRYFEKPDNLEKLRVVEEYFRKRPEIGTVLSLASVVHWFEGLLEQSQKPGPARTRNALWLVRSALGKEGLRGYVSEDFKTARVFVRARETSAVLNRASLLDDLRSFLESDARLGEVEKRITGVFLLYTNMLESLVRSQVQSFAAAFVAVLIMLSVLFRSFWVGLIAMVPNVLPILFVLGAMGFAGIHLDLATIMIASVSLGIAVDGAIHYLFRFQRELKACGSYREAVLRSHDSIGRAILVTAVTVMVGFATLGLSNFKPTAYFGLLTSFAMATALFGALTVLPALLVILRPYRASEFEPRPQGSERQGGEK